MIDRVGHLVPSSLKLKNYRINWFNFLLNQNLKPQIELIDEGYRTRSSLCEAERFLIKFYRELGVDLVNGTDGGDGGGWNKGLPKELQPMFGKRGKDAPNYGSIRTVEQKKNISVSLIGRKLSKEARKKQSIAKLGEKHHYYHKSRLEETIIKISKSHGGKLFVCIETGEQFHTLAQAGKKLNLFRQNIRKVLVRKI